MCRSHTGEDSGSRQGTSTPIGMLREATPILSTLKKGVSGEPLGHSIDRWLHDLLHPFSTHPYWLR